MAGSGEDKESTINGAGEDEREESTINNGEDEREREESSANPVDELCRFFDGVRVFPEELVHKIISLLPIEDGVRLGSLSKIWKDQWRNAPYVRLRYNSDEDVEKINKFLAGRLHLTRIEEFELICKIEPDAIKCGEVDTWIAYAVEREVTHLHVESAKTSWYVAPTGVFSCSTLIQVVLIGVDVTVKKTANWPRLKELTIDCSLLTKDSLNNMICDARKLLILNLHVGTGSCNLEIKSNSLTTLKVLYCQGGTDLFLETPSVLKIIEADKLDHIGIYGLRWTWLQFQIPCLKSAAIGFELDYPYLSNPSTVEEKLRIALLSFFHVGKIALHGGCSKLLADQLVKEEIVVRVHMCSH